MYTFLTQKHLPNWIESGVATKNRKTSLTVACAWMRATNEREREIQDEQKKAQQQQQNTHFESHYNNTQRKIISSESRTLFAFLPQYGFSIIFLLYSIYFFYSLPSSLVMPLMSECVWCLHVHVFPRCDWLALSFSRAHCISGEFVFPSMKNTQGKSECDRMHAHTPGTNTFERNERNTESQSQNCSECDIHDDDDNDRSACHLQQTMNEEMSQFLAHIECKQNISSNLWAF